MPILFALVGATGIGKSELSLRLAEHFNAEIIGVDSRQIYKGFSIGTAQPSDVDLTRVKHHLVNFLPAEQAFSAGAFCECVTELLRVSPKRQFILVGGTGLYLQSLILGLPKIPKVDEKIRAELMEIASKNSVNLFKAAQEIDPDAMKNVDINNIQRIVRVVEVWRGTSKKLSEWQKEREGGLGPVPTFWMQRNREELYARINRRVDEMVKNGWLEEIQELAKNIPLEAPAWQSLGYRELLQAKTPIAVAETLEYIKQKTRNYAKRQLTWFRGQMDCIPVDMGKNPYEEILRQIGD